MNTFETLKNFAISFNYPNHQYLAMDETRSLVLTNKKGDTKLDTILSVVERTLYDKGRIGTEEVADTVEALKIIRARLETKSSGFFNRLFFPKWTARLKAEIERIDRDLEIFDKGNTEESYYIHFISSLPEALKVKYAPSKAAEFKYKWKDEPAPETKIVNEQAAIKWLSKSVYESYDHKIQLDCVK